MRLGDMVEQYLLAFTKVVQAVDCDAVRRVAGRLVLARDAGMTVFLAGNGGSAAIASHFVNDLGKATKRPGRPPMRVMSLNDNVSWLTALANDEGYDRVFAGQLENFARPGDVLIVISSSGNSRNLILAVELARSRGVITIGFLGFDGGALKAVVDDHIWLPTEKGAYALVEPAHEMLCHLLTACLMEDDWVAPATHAAGEASGTT